MKELVLSLVLGKASPKKEKFISSCLFFPPDSGLFASEVEKLFKSMGTLIIAPLENVHFH